MAKFYGVVGYGATEESPVGSGNHIETITKREYYGDVETNIRRLENGEKINYDISVGNSISIVADAYAMQHFFNIRYIVWAGGYWRVQNVLVKPPRLILSLGDVYNGPKD